jgi:hypothetical protein
VARARYRRSDAVGTSSARGPVARQGGDTLANTEGRRHTPHEDGTHRASLCRMTARAPAPRGQHALTKWPWQASGPHRVAVARLLSPGRSIDGRGRRHRGRHRPPSHDHRGRRGRRPHGRVAHSAVGVPRPWRKPWRQLVRWDTAKHVAEVRATWSGVEVYVDVDFMPAPMRAAYRQVLADELEAAGLHDATACSQPANVLHHEHHRLGLTVLAEGCLQGPAGRNS